MSTFKSTVTINKPVNEVYSFLADMNNHKQLMPPNITDWTSTYDTASFNIQNMATLALQIDGRTENEKITILPSQKPPFEVRITWALLATGDNTNITFTIDAQLNMMMKMMASGPLQKLADHETSALVKILG